MTYRHPRNDHLRDERVRRGLTQAALGEKAGIDPIYVSMLERGVRGNPGIRIAYALSDALGVSVYDIFPRPKTHDTLNG